MKRSTFASFLLLAAALPAGTAPANAKEIAGVAIPDTQLAREATDIARAVEPPEIFNHSLRTFLFAELIAKAQKIGHDPELVYVASILHDTGLSTRYMSPKFPFEVDGANVARDLLRKHGVPEERAYLAWDAIALHDNSGIAQHKQAEVKLVNAGIGAEFGAYLDTLAHADIVAVLQAASRKNFMPVFVDAVAAVAKHKPLAAAHSFVADIGYCKVPGFTLPSFCDGIDDDPLAPYVN